MRCRKSNDIDSAVKAAREAFDSGKWTGIPANERGKIIWKIGDLIDNHAEELAQLSHLIMVSQLQLLEQQMFPSLLIFLDIWQVGQPR